MFTLLKKILSRINRISINDTYSVIKREKAILFWSNGKETNKNFGDTINPFLFEEITSIKVINSKNILNIFNQPTYYFIGSILDNLNKKNAIICGTGFQNEDAKIYNKPSCIIAVRGPLTRKIFLKYNIECPEVYCDPALLLPDIYVIKNSDKKYDIGIIAHYVDKEELNNIKIIDNGLTYCIIDIESDWKTIIDKINICKHIISSSLHGIIVAHAYNVPATRMQLTDKIVGGNFKFNDYALSVNNKLFKIYKIKNQIDLNIAIDLSTLPDTSVVRKKLLAAMKDIKY